ncbi:hypothetical protein ACFJGV_05760 [Cnuibacter sp. UC19_7]|uniref:hypothetical protein n=1 Tax=Cnuibacter sp. UC19_7 TaxID=3350166 RepID=UPI003670B333
MSGASPRLQRAITLAAATVVTVGAMLAGATAASAADDAGSGGIDIAVTTTSTPGAPAPTPSNPSPTGGSGSSGGAGAPAGGAGSGSSSGSGAGSVVGGPQDGGGQPALDTGSADTFDIGGVLFMSGVRTGFQPSINPMDGRMDVSFTVKNVSQSTFDSTADLWLTNAFGAGVGDKATVDVPALKPGESRVVSATLGGVGQWGVVNAHATFVPPSTVDGTEVPPVTRDAFAIAFPWLSGLVVVFAIGGIAVWYLLRRAMVPVFVPGTA